jgi:hypothetical protein
MSLTEGTTTRWRYHAVRDSRVITTRYSRRRGVSSDPRNQPGRR